MTPPTLALPPGTSLSAGRGGLDRVALDVPACTGEIYLHGAHVTAWAPRGFDPVIWMSGSSAYERGRPIRGGVPICFPWFGPHATHAERPAHGFARLVAWTLDGVTREDESVKVRLSFANGAEQAGLWPHRCALAYTAEFGRGLVLELTVRNVGDSPFTFAEALHTYFAIGDIRRTTVEGLAGATYVDKVRGGERFVQDDAPIRFTGETDRPYLGTTATTTIVDAAKRRRIVVRKQGSRTTVVWNPWIAKAKAMPDFGDAEWSSMLCVETANALDDAVTLAPGEEHRLRAEIAVE
jgi:D-hexose-6-phosphate mutarotase